MNENLDINQAKANKKLFISIIVLVSSLVIITMSLSYAYFSINFKGTAEVTNDAAAKFSVTSTLTSANVISADKMNLIEAKDVDTAAKKITFDVQNQSTSTVSAKYTLKIVEGSITKNLCSQYFKWKLVKGTEQIASGDFSKAVPNVTEGTTATDVASFTMEIISDAAARTLAKGVKEDLTFYVWLENNANVNQAYLTNGSFSGKLSLEAYPTKET